MKHHSKLFLLTVFLLLFMVSGSVFAQSDPDGDGVFGTKDRCPNAAGPASNNGCPLKGNGNTQNTPQEQPLHPPGDSDGDGTLDEKDKCLLDGGPSWNDGCPTDLTSPPQPTAPVALPTMPTSGQCMVATAGQAGVNVRAIPSATGAIIAVLSPSQLYMAFATYTGDDGIWYLLRNGWSSGQVLRLGGDCDQLPDFDFDGGQVNLGYGPGGSVILNFVPEPGGTPFINLHTVSAGKPVSLSFTKTDDSPDAGFSFLLMPFPGEDSSAPAPEATPSPQGEAIFGDGFLRSQMGDGSVFVMMPPAKRGEANGIIAVLIGLLRSEADPAGILIGLSQPSFDPTKILIGLSQPGSNQDGTQGILIGLLLPAVKTGDVNPSGILIGLLQPSIQGGQDEQFGFSNEPFGQGGAEVHPGGANNPGEQVSVQKVRGLGLDMFVPSAGAPASNLFTAGWGVQIEGAGVPQ